jgi:hypothetical protein
MRQWSEKRDSLYYLNEFSSLKKRANETVVEFKRRFNNIYNNIPAGINPSQPTTKVTYTGAFDVYLSMTLRERRSLTLLVMQEDALDIEGNMIASCKMKQKKDQEENKKFMEDCGTSDPSREPQEAKMDEMSRLIRNLTKTNV